MAGDQTRIKLLPATGEKKGVNQGSLYTPIVKGCYVVKSEFVAFLFYAGPASIPAVKGNSCRIS